MRVLATGGAGSLGADFGHWTLRHRPDAEDDLVVRFAAAPHDDDPWWRPQKDTAERTYTELGR